MRFGRLLAGLAVLALGHVVHADSGRFVVKPPLVESASMRSVAREMSGTGALEELATAFNALFVLPTDIAIRYAECGEANAYYDSDEKQILMCLELVEGMTEVLADQFEDEEDLTDAIAGAFIAVALHEVGHALVDVLELPVTGREEDAVDQLAAWILIQADDVDSVLGAAATYYVDDDIADEDLAGEHSLDKQRYYNMVCWAYGSDPENSRELIDTWELPEDRAEGCEAEYALLDRSWSRLLKPHLREDGLAGLSTGQGGAVETAAAAAPRPSTEAASGFPFTRIRASTDAELAEFAQGRGANYQGRSRLATPFSAPRPGNVRVGGPRDRGKVADYRAGQSTD